MAISVSVCAGMPVAILARLHPVGGGVGHETDVLDLIVHCRLQQGVELGGFLRRDTRIRDFNGE